mmetsp:Transcript_951/g.3068  ORF Transcript_951/g.3068 Transcript_951/m.3068 type:complete len:438 (-) Transcript_951:382-1695(-)
MSTVRGARTSRCSREAAGSSCSETEPRSSRATSRIAWPPRLVLCAPPVLPRWCSSRVALVPCRAISCACFCGSAALETCMTRVGSWYSMASSISMSVPYLRALETAFSSAYRSRCQSSCTSGTSKARTHTPASAPNSATTLATTSTGKESGTYSCAAIWKIMMRKCASSCARFERVCIVASVALACRIASNECSRTASRSSHTFLSSGLWNWAAASRCAASCFSMMPSCSSVYEALTSCDLCKFLSSCCSLAATCRSFSASMRNLKSVRSWHTTSTLVKPSTPERSTARQRSVRSLLLCVGLKTARSRIGCISCRAAASSSRRTAPSSTVSRKRFSPPSWKYSPNDLEDSYTRQSAASQLVARTAKTTSLSRSKACAYLLEMESFSDCKRRLEAADSVCRFSESPSLVSASASYTAPYQMVCPLGSRFGIELALSHL